MKIIEFESKQIETLKKLVYIAIVVVLWYNTEVLQDF